MMVTFVSQCEKKALPRTRRVLDAFANRIGDNTWQTIITEDGLITVKKMLRQTASKSTAVSCHWIRSRSRSEFLWVVGNKKQFGFGGVVPVNKTEVEDIKQDESKNMNENIYANTQKQPLSQHLFAVGYVAALMVERLLGDDGRALRQAALVSGCLHDIGKLDPEFRIWLEGVISKRKNNEVMTEEDGLHIDKAKFSFENHPRHNEISLWLAQFIDLLPVLSNKKLIGLIEHTVYWHHAKPIRKDEYIKINDIHRKLKSSYKEKGMKELLENCRYLLSEVSEISASYDAGTKNIDFPACSVVYDDETVDDFRKIELPVYKQYELEEDFREFRKDINTNAKANILRSCVISADRKVSALTSDQLTQYIDSGTLDLLVNDALNQESDLPQQIQNCLSGFEQKYPDSERNKAQSIAACELLGVEHVAVLNGPAGCGKTKIALEWAKLGEAKKIIWVCPRVQVCEGLYHDLTSSEYLSDGSIEICTGEFKFINDNGMQKKTAEGDEFSASIVLTTIDQVINSITTHSNVTAFVDFMNSHVVFDEYHEYIPMPAFNLLFSELIQAKKLMGQDAKTLLVSATPNYCFVERILDIDSEDIVDINSFNTSLYQINFEEFDETVLDESNPLFKAQPKNSIVISNTATTAQQAFIRNQDQENSILFHGKYIAKDKQVIFDKVFDCFKHAGSHTYDVLRSGPIVQAALNITCEHMTSEFTLAENFLQRLGRLDRFGESSQVNRYTIAIPEIVIESKGKIMGNCARFLNSSHGYRSAYAWFEFLEANLPESPLTINEIYRLYRHFYESTKGVEAVEQDMLCALKESVNVISAKVHDPIRYIKRSKDNTKKKLKKSSLRGDSRFVQMVVVDIDDINDYVVTNEYAVDWQDGDNDFSSCYTESLKLIRDTGLMDYVAKKHGRIDETSPMAKIPSKSMQLRKQVLEGAAVEPAYPIYLSYSPKDMTEKLGEELPDESAIYYLRGTNQIIGAMPLSKFSQS